jgi:hypothetical protein
MGQVNTKKIFFDIDGVICHTHKGDYSTSAPNVEMINLINELYNQGHTITLYTARFMGRSNGDEILAKELGYQFTLDQMKTWKIKFHHLVLGKPVYDIFIDDRAIGFQGDVLQLREELNNRLVR